MDTAKQSRNTPSRDVDVELGQRAHMLIWSSGRKQGDVAAEMGVSSGSLGLKLKGQRGWALAEIVALAEVLGTTVGYLVGETDQPDPNLPPSDYKLAVSADFGHGAIANISDWRTARTA